MISTVNLLVILKTKSSKLTVLPLSCTSLFHELASHEQVKPLPEAHRDFPIFDGLPECHDVEEILLAILTAFEGPQTVISTDCSCDFHLSLQLRRVPHNRAPFLFRVQTSGFLNSLENSHLNTETGVIIAGYCSLPLVVSGDVLVVLAGGVTSDQPVKVVILVFRDLVH